MLTRGLTDLLRISCLLSLALARTSAAENPIHADVIFWNGQIYPMQAANDTCEALGIQGERIIFTGTKQAAQSLISNGTTIVDLAGRIVLPGFTDAHVHPVHAGLNALGCDLQGADNLDAIATLLSDYAAKHPNLPWIRGSNLHLPSILNLVSPRGVLDNAVADRPVFLVTSGNHSAFVNTKALQLAEITATTEDPPQGIIGREPNTNEPSGALFEAAMKRVSDLLPSYGREQRAEALEHSLKVLNSFGITNLIEANASEPELLAYLDVAQAGRLSAHANLSLHAELADGIDCVRDVLDLRERLQAFEPQRHDVRLNHVKLFLDGTVEEQTAAMLANYRGSNHRGTPLADRETTSLVIAALDRQGLQIHVHAIGDRAIRMALDGFEQARKLNGTRDSRHHIAHLNVVHPNDIARFETLEVTANFQALWATIDDPYVNDINRRVLQPEPFRWQYPMGSIRRAGGRLVFGSDWPVSTPDPFSAIQVAVTRRGPDHVHREPWTPQHLLNVETAVEGYTRLGSWLTFRESECGTLTVGKLADLVILNADPFHTPPFRLIDLKVDRTYFRGQLVYQRADSASSSATSSDGQ